MSVFLVGREQTGWENEGNRLATSRLLSAAENNIYIYYIFTFARCRTKTTVTGQKICLRILLHWVSFVFGKLKIQKTRVPRALNKC